MSSRNKKKYQKCRDRSIQVWKQNHYVYINNITKLATTN